MGLVWDYGLKFSLTVVMLKNYLLLGMIKAHFLAALFRVCQKMVSIKNSLGNTKTSDSRTLPSETDSVVLGRTPNLTF